MLDCCRFAGILEQELNVKAESTRKERAVARIDPADQSKEELSAYVEQLEAELSTSRQLEEIGILSKIIAHDLNNFLTPILGYATIIKREIDQNAPCLKGIGIIEKAAERAAGLVGQLLGTVRQVAIAKAPLDIDQMIASLLEQFPPATEGKVEIITNISSQLPPAQGNRHQLERALLCLIENGCEAMPDGGRLKIETGTKVADAQFCRSHAQVSQGNYLCISVSDSGKGIPADIAGRIFEPFFSTKPAQAGRGIGLTLVSSIIKLHGGAIDVESSDDNGTTFRIYLPESKP